MFFYVAHYIHRPMNNEAKALNIYKQGEKNQINTNGSLGVGFLGCISVLSVTEAQYTGACQTIY